MFRRTRIRLAVLNTLILFIILNLFGGALYLYTQKRLYRRVDYSLLAVANRLYNEQFRDLPLERGFGRQADRNVVILLWDKEGQLLFQAPPEAFFSSDVDKLRANLTRKDFRTITTTDGHKYRSLALQVSPKDGLGKLNPDRLSAVSTIQLVINIDPESEMLKDLVVIVLIGGLAGGLVSLLAGLFLANRALIPIKEAWDKQQQFVADASHELRTPLSVIQGQLELLFRHPDHTIEQDSIRISGVLTEVKRMVKMVAQLLTLARTDSNQLELERKDFYLDELIRDTAEQFKQLAETKQISLETLLGKQISFFGDRERIKQLLIILLDNALKYTPELGTIRIIGNQIRHELKIIVEDTGIGISAEDLPFIFDRFYRSDKARSRAGGGTGLGLAIAKWIVQAHHGTIWAESKVSEGTQIHISFPSKRLGRA